MSHVEYFEYAVLGDNVMQRIPVRTMPNEADHPSRWFVPATQEPEKILISDQSVPPCNTSKQ